MTPTPTRARAIARFATFCTLIAGTVSLNAADSNDLTHSRSSE